jgi:serine/arginine repetitive matrix protein 1
MNCSKERKLLRTLKFPKEFELKVEFKKVNWEVMKTWIAKRVTELLGLEDEVVIGYIYEQFEAGEVSLGKMLIQD